MKEDSSGWETFELRMTVAIAMSSGGAAVGTFFDASLGAILGGVVCGVAGFWLGDCRDSRPDDGKTAIKHK